MWDVEATKMVKSYRGIKWNKTHVLELANESPPTHSGHYGQTLSVSAHPTSSACFLSTGQVGIPHE